MAIRVLVFDPLSPGEVNKFAQDLDFYLRDGWTVLTAVAGNRTGVARDIASVGLSSVRSPEFKDYVVFVLQNDAASQGDMEPAEVARRSQ